MLIDVNSKLLIFCRKLVPKISTAGVKDSILFQTQFRISLEDLGHQKINEVCKINKNGEIYKDLKHESLYGQRQNTLSELQHPQINVDDPQGDTFIQYKILMCSKHIPLRIYINISYYY